MSLFSGLSFSEGSKHDTPGGGKIPAGNQVQQGSILLGEMCFPCSNDRAWAVAESAGNWRETAIARITSAVTAEDSQTGITWQNSPIV